MKHAYIAPTKYLHLIPEYSDFHLLLAHLLKDPNYAEFYRMRQAKGDTIMIDNGAFEHGKPMELDDLDRIVSESGVRPDILVLPDYPKESWTMTVRAAEVALDSLAKNNPFGSECDFMSVPQSTPNDHEGWIQCYKELSYLTKWIGMSILGIPNAFAQVTGTSDISFNRTFATQILKNRSLIKAKNKHHYLGCGDPREIAIMVALGVADSNDSSTAFWHGIQGLFFDPSSGGLQEGKSNIPVDFDIEYRPEMVNAIRYNITWIEYLIKRTKLQN